MSTPGSKPRTRDASPGSPSKLSSKPQSPIKGARSNKGSLRSTPEEGTKRGGSAEIRNLRLIRASELSHVPGISLDTTSPSIPEHGEVESSASLLLSEHEDLSDGELEIEENPAKNVIDLVHRVFLWNSSVPNLENHQFLLSNDRSGRDQYIFKCQELGVAPLLHLTDQLGSPKVSMRHYGLREKDAVAVAECLKHNFLVQALDLCGNMLRATGGVAIANSLLINSTLTALNLRSDRLGPEGGLAIGEMLSTNRSLTTLNISNNAIGDKAITCISEALLNNNVLTKLDMSSNEIGLTGGTALAAMLESNIGLQDIDLSWNSLRSNASVALCQAIKVNCNLKKLALGWNGVGSKAAAELGHALTVNRSLTFLDISNCRIGEEACSSLAEAVRVNPNLLALRLDNNPLGKPGAQAIMAAYNETKLLSHFTLNNCAMESDFLFVYDEANPSGHYKLHVADASDRQVAASLLKMCTEDLGNSWRNESFDGVPFDFPAGGNWPLPNKGILEMDHVAQRPPYLEQAELVEGHEYKIFLRSLRFAASDSDRLSQLRVFLSTRYTVSADAVPILLEFVSESDRCNAAVVLYSRISDRDHYYNVCDSFSTAGKDELMRRMGPVPLFNPSQPMGFYTFNMAKKIDRDLLLQLLALCDSAKANGVNYEVRQVTYNALPFALPDSNAIAEAPETVLPMTGHLSFYFGLPANMPHTLLPKKVAKKEQPVDERTTAEAGVGSADSQKRRRKKKAVMATTSTQAGEDMMAVQPAPSSADGPLNITGVPPTPPFQQPPWVPSGSRPTSKAGSTSRPASRVTSSRGGLLDGSRPPSVAFPPPSAGSPSRPISRAIASGHSGSRGGKESPFPAHVAQAAGGESAGDMRPMSGMDAGQHAAAVAATSPVDREGVTSSSSRRRSSGTGSNASRSSSRQSLPGALKSETAKEMDSLLAASSPARDSTVLGSDGAQFHVSRASKTPVDEVVGEATPK